MSTSGQEISEIEVKREDDSAVVPGQGKYLVVRKAMERLLAQVENVMLAFPQHLARTDRDPDVREESHQLAAASG
jgi:hypothetical protein